MKLMLFKTLWGHTGGIEFAIRQALDANFQGIEGPAPLTAHEASYWRQSLDDFGLAYIAEITTAGSYVPDRHASLEQHLSSFRRKLDMSLPLAPIFITCLGGCDAWPEGKNIDFFASAMEYANSVGVDLSFETHRGRAFFNPWVTERIVRQVPEIKLTCDFSHWCVVCERLMDTETETLERIAQNAHHIHARVGYDQGPQVSHPAAPQYHDALTSHARCWEQIWEAQRQKGHAVFTMTPEFGPDGYQQTEPFTGEAVGDLWEINCWMAKHERAHFENWCRQVVGGAG